MNGFTSVSEHHQIRSILIIGSSSHLTTQKKTPHPLLAIRQCCPQEKKTNWTKSIHFTIPFIRFRCIAIKNEEKKIEIVIKLTKHESFRQIKIEKSAKKIKLMEKM